MKITSEQVLASPTEERLTIEIVFNPKSEEEEGLVALVATLADFVKNYRVLQSALNDMDSNESGT
jgi:hypothetical protein